MNSITELCEKLLKAQSVSALTGAGISAESGVATFRGENGLWRKFKPEELANVNAFLKNPELVWEWYNERKKIVRSVQPNPGHFALAEFENILNGFTLITQNVDGLHRRAGSSRILELHGNIERSFCMQCGNFYDNVEISEEIKVPHCSVCNGLIRPDVVWFGEMLPQDILEEAERSAMRCDFFFVVGTSAEVYPAASLPITAKQYGARIIEINIAHTSLSNYADYTFFGKAGEVLPQFISIIKQLRKLTQ
jgi:NAD-dependent deacetylase